MFPFLLNESSTPIKASSHSGQELIESV